MFNPQTGNNEFIELYNNGDSPLNLTDYKFQYSTSNPDAIVETGNGMILNPKSFAVIFEGDYDIQSGIYNDIPSDVLILRTADNSFGSNGMANSSDRQIKLISRKMIP